MKLLKKDLRLALSPLTPLFLLFSFMALIPRYPILVGAFFVCLGVFYSFQQAREAGDILYTVLLPIRKIGPTAKAYPRKAGTPSKKPLGAAE